MPICSIATSIRSAPRASIPPIRWRRAAGFAATLAIGLGATVLAGTPALAGDGNSYVVHNLVSDGSVPADHTDPNLRNAWGVAFNPNGFVWVANNHTGTSTLYDGTGVPQSLVVAVPAASGSGIGAPTGIVYSGSLDFAVSAGTLTGPSRFIFASEDGLISGWSPDVDLTHALPAVTTPGAIYKGLALAGNGSGNFLYATDFHHRRVDVFNNVFAKVTTPGGFTDPTIPSGFAPFGIQNVAGNLYVTYAKQGPGGVDDQHGMGLGFVNVFDPDGHLLHRLATRVGLNAPWGIAIAPDNFGRFSNRVLVGNFGDGTIAAYDQHDHHFLERLRNPDGTLVRIPGLWGMQFGNGIQGQPTNTLFFAAGPNGEEGGVYGSLTAGE